MRTGKKHIKDDDSDTQRSIWFSGHIVYLVWPYQPIFLSQALINALNLLQIKFLKFLTVVRRATLIVARAPNLN